MEKEKNQLHQLLAAEKDLNNISGKILKETINTFQKKDTHFDGLQKVYKPFNEDGEKIPPQIKNVVTTVKEKLDYAKKSVIDSVDASISLEETNASGTVKASLKVGSLDFGELSSTALLNLEKSLMSIRMTYESIPTLDPTKKWHFNDISSGGVFETDVEENYRTIKTPMPIELVAATKEHPAQVQLVNQDIQIGKYETVYQSGRIKPIDKSNLLKRIDALIIAVKKAKAKANQAEVVNVKIGNKIFDYIHKDII